MTTRRDARILALQAIFQMDVGRHPPESALQNVLSDVSDVGARGYVQEMVEGVWKNLQTIDRVIATRSSNWKIDRLNRVDRTILRLALHEMLFRDDIPPAVSINEAVELAREYGGEESSSFVNGILGSLIPQNASTIDREKIMQEIENSTSAASAETPATVNASRLAAAVALDGATEIVPDDVPVATPKRTRRKPASSEPSTTTAKNADDGAPKTRRAVRKRATPSPDAADADPLEPAVAAKTVRKRASRKKADGDSGAAEPMESTAAKAAAVAPAPVRKTRARTKKADEATASVAPPETATSVYQEAFEQQELPFQPQRESGQDRSHAGPGQRGDDRSDRSGWTRERNESRSHDVPRERYESGSNDVPRERYESGSNDVPRERNESRSNDVPRERNESRSNDVPRDRMSFGPRRGRFESFEPGRRHTRSNNYSEYETTSYNSEREARPHRDDQRREGRGRRDNEGRQQRRPGGYQGRGQARDEQRRHENRGHDAYEHQRYEAYDDRRGGYDRSRDRDDTYYDDSPRPDRGSYNGGGYDRGGRRSGRGPQQRGGRYNGASNSRYHSPGEVARGEREKILPLWALPGARGGRGGSSHGSRGQGGYRPGGGASHSGSGYGSNRWRGDRPPQDRMRDDRYPDDDRPRRRRRRRD